MTQPKAGAGVFQAYHRQVCGWLSRAGIQYVEEYQVAGFSLDIYIPELRLALELDGPSHALSRRKDAIKDEALAAIGIEVRRYKVGTPKGIIMRDLLE